jgi:hypothetical protein
MKRKIVFAVFAVIITMAIITRIFVFPQLELNRRIHLQKVLGNDLGIQIGDTFNPFFPIGYFDSVLKPGMDISEVHKNVIGYKKVFRCYWGEEIYYYFSSEDDKALRFEIFYDDLGKYKELRSEDQNSRTIRVDNCEPGLLEATK